MGLELSKMRMRIEWVHCGRVASREDIALGSN